MLLAQPASALVIGLINFAVNLKHIKMGDVRKAREKEDMSLGQICLYVFVPAIFAAILGYILPRLIFHTTIMGTPSSDAFIFACVPILGFFISLWVRARGEDKKGIGALLFIFAISVIFWSLFYQNFIGYTLWTEVHTDRTIKSKAVEKAVSLFLQNVNTSPRKVDSLNAWMVPVKR